MNSGRPKLFQVVSAYELVPVVTLYEDTWSGHILGRHFEMEGHLEAVKQAIVSPTMVCLGTNRNPGSYVFVNGRHASPESGAPLAVCVKGDPFIVSTAHFNESLITPSPARIVWVPPKK